MNKVLYVPLRKINSFIIYIIAACLILNCNSVYELSGMISEKIVYAIIFVVICLFCCVYRKMIFERDSKKKWLIILGLGVYQVSHMILRDGFNKWFIIKFILCLMGLLTLLWADDVWGDKPFYKILCVFSKLVLGLAIMSLLFWLLGQILHIIPATGTVHYIWGSPRAVDSFFGLHFSAQEISLLGHVFYRNTGIFTEAPMFAFVLSVAFLNTIFLEKKTKPIKILILFITICTTVSATGVIVSSLAVIIKLLQVKHINKICVCIFTGVCLLVIGAAFGYKMTRGSATSSFNIRVQDYEIIVKSMRDKFFLGYGYERYDEIVYQYMDPVRKFDTGGSNGFFYPLTQGGILFFIPYLLAFILICRKNIKEKNYSELFFWGLYLVLFSASIISLKLISLLFIAQGITSLIPKEAEPCMRTD